jgi:hypothetical protein
MYLVETKYIGNDSKGISSPKLTLDALSPVAALDGIEPLQLSL